MNYEIRAFKESDREAVLGMMRIFYASPAVLSNGSEEIFRADRKDLERTGILSRKELDSLDSRDLKPADQVLEDCRRHGYGILTIQDAAYPARLRTIDMPPLVLYYQGTLLSFDLNRHFSNKKLILF